MEHKSCLISNQKLIKSSKEIFDFAEKIATECSLLTSDLIVAAVWHCLNQTHSTKSSACSSIAVESSGEEHKRQEENGDSEENRASKSAEYTVNEKRINLHLDKPEENRDIKKAKKQPDKEAERKSDAGDDEKAELWIVGEVESKIDNIDKQKANHFVTASGDQLKTISKEVQGNQRNIDEATEGRKGVANISERLSTEPKSKLLLKLDKNIRLLKNTKVGTEETNEQANIAADKKVTDVTHTGNKEYTQEKEKPASTASCKDSQSKQNEGKSQNEKKRIADVEIISIDDDDSNDIPGGIDDASITKNDIVANNVKEKKAEEKEPDYFDMDCDEIDDENDGYEYEELLDFTADETDKSGKCTEESNVKIRSTQKVVDVTIISDDEDDREAKVSDKSVSQSLSKGESLDKTCQKSDIDKSHINTTSSKKQAVSEGTRRKQSLTNVKKDFTGNVEVKTEEKSLVDRSSENVATRIICPAMEHLDNMTVPKPRASAENAVDKNSLVPSVSDDNAPSTSAVAVLGLVPVGDAQKSVDNATSTHEDSSLSQIFPTLASNQSIYVSSGIFHGSIPSLPPVQDLHNVTDIPHVTDIPGNQFADILHSSHTVTSPSQCSSATQESFQFHQHDLQAQTSYYSQEQPPGEEFSSPPRKKRLLDYDKKWHMEPKFSPEQDKDDAIVKPQEATLDRVKIEPEDFELQVNMQNKRPLHIQNEMVLATCSDTESYKYGRECINTTKGTLFNVEYGIPANAGVLKQEMEEYGIVTNTNIEMLDDRFIKAEVRVNTDDESTDCLDKELSGNSETGRRRTFYSPLVKLQFIERLKNGESQTSISRETDIPGSTLRTWLKSEEQIRGYLDAINSRLAGRKRHRDSESPSGKKRENYTIYEKLKTIDRINNGESRANVCRDLDLAESTLRGWLKDEKRLKNEIQTVGCRPRQKNKAFLCRIRRKTPNESQD